VTTLEGIGTPANPHPLQSAFLDKQAGQCAYCANAMIMGALSWLQGRIAAGNKAVPTTDEVNQFLSNSVYTDPMTGVSTPTPYLCRCGAHTRFVSAIQEAAQGMV
jgi:aerobic-type carbon monoxide dehydrogenase small subunit (CoxS/CutS family)